MKLIIDISEEKYDWIMNHLTLDRNFRECKITPLPKGHGNLYDERDLEKLGKVYFQEEVITNDSNLEYRFPKLIINATPIVEADNGESEK